MIYINSNAKVAKALRSEENLEITLGAKKEKPVAGKYMIPKATAPKDSISQTKTQIRYCRLEQRNFALYWNLYIIYNKNIYQRRSKQYQYSCELLLHHLNKYDVVEEVLY